MRGMVRIRAKALQAAAAQYDGGLSVNGVLPSWVDVEIYVVGPDGVEIPLTGVRSFELKACQGSDPLVASLECFVDELDVLAKIEVEG